MGQADAVNFSQPDRGPYIGGLLLTPGAGADRHQRTLVAVEQAVAPLPCERVDFPYRLRGSRMPDKPEVAIAHLAEQAAALVDRWGIAPQALVLGGRSYGGRMCSMAVAQGVPAAALVLLSYPLHPPGKPERLRTEHFGQIRVPVLVVSGRGDPFGTTQEFERELAAIPGPVTTVWLPGGHDPRRYDEVAGIVAGWLGELAAGG
jgi:predicted alpha/beta-hydrolase family hydrolase